MISLKEISSVNIFYMEKCFLHCFLLLKYRAFYVQHLILSSFLKLFLRFELDLYRAFCLTLIQKINKKQKFPIFFQIPKLLLHYDIRFYKHN